MASGTGIKLTLSGVDKTKAMLATARLRMVKFGAAGTANVKYRAKDMSTGKWMPGTYSTSGTTVLAEKTGKDHAALVPLLLKKPVNAYAEVGFNLSADGQVSSSFANTRK